MSFWILNYKCISFKIMIYIKFVPDIKFSRLSISLSIGLFNMKTFIFKFVFLLIATVKLALCFIMTTRVKRCCNLFWIMIYPSCHSAGGKFIYSISFIMMKLVVYTKLILQNNYHIKILNLDIGLKYQATNRYEFVQQWTCWTFLCIL
jgi:hypothetical protein